MLVIEKEGGQDQDLSLFLNELVVLTLIIGGGWLYFNNSRIQAASTAMILELSATNCQSDWSWG